MHAKLHSPTFYKHDPILVLGQRPRDSWSGFPSWDGIKIFYQVASGSFLVSVPCQRAECSSPSSKTFNFLYVLCPVFEVLTICARLSYFAPSLGCMDTHRERPTFKLV